MYLNMYWYLLYAMNSLLYKLQYRAVDSCTGETILINLDLIYLESNLSVSLGCVMEACLHQKTIPTALLSHEYLLLSRYQFWY